MMKNLLFLIPMFSFFWACSPKEQTSSESQPPESVPVKVMSYNIRYDNPQDSVKGNGWDTRKHKIVALIRHYAPDLIGTQEALAHQVEFLGENLEGYQWKGVGRDDGKRAGEFAPVLYNSHKFELLESNTFWLSETPEKPSKAWDAALPRIATWAKMKEKASGKIILMINTHFDHVGKEARKQSMRLLKQKAKEMVGDLPVVITGDFNCTPDSEPYAEMTGSDGYQDAFVASARPSYGPQGSFTGFIVCEENSLPRIDYIFFNAKVKVEKHEIINDFSQGRYPSDHLPLLATLNF
ncbi:endonuclease/exonuclease/phosphatase family protein [Rapidithrix thailandica]|uniref:Endonuclease/exonuclease/phosphatase family protein n=1 Tax=Rapidithrix thailandica TaxID=413964 RepID=A0AAW9SGI6_9BACT